MDDKDIITHVSINRHLWIRVCMQQLRLKKLFDD